MLINDRLAITSSDSFKLVAFNDNRDCIHIKFNVNIPHQGIAHVSIPLISA